MLLLIRHLSLYPTSLGQQGCCKGGFLMTTKYNYKKYEGLNPWSNDMSDNFDFFGIHFINGKMEIDIARYIEACKLAGIDDFLPEEFKIKKEGFYTSPKKSREEYMANIYRDSIGELANDWETEYKPLFEKITTPSQVKEGYRLDQMMYTSCVDDYEEIEIDAMFAGLRRKTKYLKIINELYCLFITKICTEVDRISLLAMSKSGYTDTDFTYKQFRAFSEGLLKDGEHCSIESLKKFNAYNMLHKINNFLKHNSIDSYKTLKKMYPNNVASLENNTAQCEYENGMFAADWVILKPNYIDEIFGKLRIFFDNYCESFYKEDLSRVSWDYEEYFNYAVEQMSHPFEYLGI